MVLLFFFFPAFILEKYQENGEANNPSIFRKDKQDNCAVRGHNWLENNVRENSEKLIYNITSKYLRHNIMQINMIWERKKKKMRKRKLADDVKETYWKLLSKTVRAVWQTDFIEPSKCNIMFKGKIAEMKVLSNYRLDSGRFGKGLQYHNM